jgi:hypothetical protein
LRVCSRVGQVTFFSSDQASSINLRIRLTTGLVSPLSRRPVAPDARTDRSTWMVAGAAGLEPTTTGFGDQSSTD